MKLRGLTVMKVSMLERLIDEKHNTVIEFIRRRFKDDCKWSTGNCYYFALILKERFCNYDPEIYYDVVEGHFLCKIENVFYDWNGIANYTDEYTSKYIKRWSTYHNEDIIHWERIVRDVIM